jgi:hypothetical protein
MLWLGIEESSKGIKDRLDIKGGFPTLHRTFDEVHLVITDDTNQDETDVLLVPQIPPMGALSLRGGVVRGREAKERNTVRHPVTGDVAFLYEVVVEYDSAIEEDDGGQSPEPTNLRPKRRWYSEKVKERLVKDPITNLPLMTKAGEEIVFEHDVTVGILEIKRYGAAPFDPNKKFTYENHTNDGEFYGAPTGCALMDTVDAEEVIINGVRYEQETYIIKFKFKDQDKTQANGWMASVIHQGYLYLPFNGAHIADARTKLDKNGTPVRVNLETTGELLLGNGLPNYIEFNEFPKVSFGPLQLVF